MWKTTFVFLRMVMINSHSGWHSGLLVSPPASVYAWDFNAHENNTFQSEKGLKVCKRRMQCSMLITKVITDVNQYQCHVLFCPAKQTQR